MSWPRRGWRSPWSCSSRPRRGVTPGRSASSCRAGTTATWPAGQATRILAWAIFAEVLGGVINAALQTGHYPTSQPNAPELIFAMAASIQAGVVEELVVLAFAVVTLRQAGRPLWEVTIVVLVLRGSYHIYYGPGVLGILVWAALFYWIYLRTGNVLVLMVGHAGWDAVGFLSQRWPGVAGVGVLFAIAIWIAAPITWLVERNRPRRPGPVAPGRPGAVSPAARGLAARSGRCVPLAVVGWAALDRPRLGPVNGLDPALERPRLGHSDGPWSDDAQARHPVLPPSAPGTRLDEGRPADPGPVRTHAVRGPEHQQRARRTGRQARREGVAHSRRGPVRRDPARPARRPR